MSYQTHTTAAAAAASPIAGSNGQISDDWLGSGSPAAGNVPIWSSANTRAWGAISSGTGAIVSFSDVSTDQNLTNGSGACFDPTNSALVATAPGSASINNIVGVMRGGTAAVAAKNRVYFIAPGVPINGVNSLVYMSQQYNQNQFRYINTTIGWAIDDASKLTGTCPIPGINFLYLPNATWTQSGGVVNSVKDHSGNSYTATQTGTARPTYNATGINSGPAMDFGGVDDFLSAGAGAMVTTGTFWVACVFVPDTVATANQELVCKFNNTNMMFAMRINSSKLDTRVVDQSTGGIRGRESTNVLVNGTKYVAIMEFDGASSVTQTIDNVDQPTVLTAGIFNGITDTTAPLRLGARHTTPTGFFDGKISCAMGGSATLSAANRSALYTFLNSL